MTDDPIVNAVREVRDQLAARFNYDVHAIFADMRSREQQAGDLLIPQPVKEDRVVTDEDHTALADELFQALDAEEADKRRA